MLKFFASINFALLLRRNALIYISAFFLLTPTPARAESFFETLYDVPVMEGLTEVPAMALSFDKPNGRIAEAGAATKDKTATEIQTFYEQTLTALGWGKTASGVFVREKEKMYISIDDRYAMTVVRFSLQPL